MGMKRLTLFVKLNSSVVELHHFCAALASAPDLGKNFDTAPAVQAPAPTLLYSKAKFF
jgi:hypothetical protein